MEIQLGKSLLNPEDGWTRKYCSEKNIGAFFQGVRGNGQFPNGRWYQVGDDRDLRNGTSWYVGGESNSFSFKFRGTSLRIMARELDIQSFNLEVSIDGNSFMAKVPVKTPNLFVVFEKLNLINQEHNVVITTKGHSLGNTGQEYYTWLQAIDYADLSVKVGNLLKQPEMGWKRVNNTDSLIKYTEDMKLANDDTLGKRNCFMNDYTAGKAGTILFEFVGTKLRILGITYKDYSSDIAIEIDGVKQKFSALNLNTTDFLQGSTLVYEKNGLDFKKHSVKIYNSDATKLYGIDAIDIDETGYLASTVKIGDVYNITEFGWKRYDDTNHNIEYIGEWYGNHTNPTGKYDDYYNKTLHYFYRDGEGIARFKFKGTKIRIIAGVPDDYSDKISIKIDDVEEFFSERILENGKRTGKRQVLVYEKTNLDLKEHTVILSDPKISGFFNGFNIDAIEIDAEGELLPYKQKVSLYKKVNGNILVDDFDSINPKWLMSPSNEFNNTIKKGFLRMNHSADKDVMLLIDKPQDNFAIQVIADYAPTKEGDEGGLLIYQNEKNKVEFLESYSANSSQSHKEWMAICKENQWDFYTKTDTSFDYMDNDSLDAKRIGVVLKRGTAEGFVPLDINKIIMTKSNMLRLRQLYENYKVVLKDTADNILSTNIVAAPHTGIDILLPSLEFEGIVEIYDEENELLAKKQSTFYGGDMY
ncbi:hypothetical protein COL22_26490, partial [Bacillus thuringiensis]